MNRLKNSRTRDVAKTLLASLIAVLVAITMPTQAKANNFDDLFEIEYCSIIRQDDEGTYYGTATVDLTITYDNEMLKRAKERDFEIEKYRELRLDTQTGFTYFQPEVTEDEGQTFLHYNFQVENGREAAFWIIEDLHKRSVQPSLSVAITIPDTMHIEYEMLGEFHDEIQYDGPSSFHLVDATVVADERDKAGIPNARIKWKVAGPPTDGEGENPEDSEESDPPSLWDDDGKGPRKGSEDPTQGPQTGDAFVMIGAAIITVSLMLLIVVLKRRKKHEA